MKNIHSLKINIKEMFNEFGLKMLSNTSPQKAPYLPNEYDISHFRLGTEQQREKDVKSFLLSSNHFRVIDLELFLPNLINNLSPEDHLFLETMFYSVRIFYENNRLTLNYYSLLDKLILNLSQNKFFMERFPKEFQVKSLFLNEQNKIDDIQENLAFLILNKINDLNFKEKFLINLPKLVVKELIIE